MDTRYALFCKLIDTFDAGYMLSLEYDSMPHHFYGEVLYQSESHTIQFIGKNPKTTMMVLAKAMGKTPSACSQTIRKLCKKGWVEQLRNPENNREYFLELTETGWQIFKKHEQFDQDCYKRNCESLARFTDEQLETYIAVQSALNESFRKDVERSRIQFN